MIPDFNCLAVLDGDVGGDSAPGGEAAFHDHLLGRAGRNQVVEDLVRRRLVEDALIAIREHVVFQRLELDAGLVGRVRDDDLAEVRQAGFRTHRRELVMRVCLLAGVFLSAYKLDKVLV